MKLSTPFIALALALSSFSPIAAQSDASALLPKPLVHSGALQALVSGITLRAHARQFLKFSELSSGTRVFGSKGHNATVDYIKGLLDATGYYDTHFQTFNYLYSAGTSTVTIAGSALPSRWFTYGPAGDVTAPLVSVDNVGCLESDFPSSVVGKIALIKRGTCTFAIKIALAGKSGAAGAIIFNNLPEALSGTLGSPVSPIGPYVPAASLSGDDGDSLVLALARGSEIVATLKVDAVTEDRPTSNVIATTKGGDKNNIIFAGGHSDSVAAGPGINDDGSGAISVLDIALRLPLFNVKNAVRFGFWTAEEFGLVGSNHYVTGLSTEEQQKVALYLNFDMVASPNFGYFIYDGDGSAFNLTGPPGSDHIEKTFEDWFKSKRLTSAPTAFSGRSDYGPFLDAGIPSGGLFTGAEGRKTAEQAGWWGGEAGVAYDVCYHQQCDHIENLNLDAWVQNTRAAAHAIATYARSLDGVPRTTRFGPKANRVAGLSYDERAHYSCGHEIFSL